MNASSPLGKYAPLVASIVAVLLIGGYIIAVEATGLGAHFDPTALQQLHDFAFIAGGFIFGTALGVNGWKAPVTSLHTRLDTIEAQTVSTASVVGAPVIARPTSTE